MQKEEFQKLTGIRELSEPDYEKIEEAYYNIPNMDKQTFCEFYAHNLPALLEALTYEVKRWHTEAKQWKQSTHVLAEAIISGHGDEALCAAADTIGISEVIKIKAENGIELDDNEVEYLKQNLK